MWGSEGSLGRSIFEFIADIKYILITTNIKGGTNFRNLIMALNMSDDDIFSQGRNRYRISNSSNILTKTAFQNQNQLPPPQLEQPAFLPGLGQELGIGINIWVSRMKL